jgi:L-aminopeptidase/D-esterase-like protein
MARALRGAITDIPGIRVGHAQDEQALTGCTVILCEAGAVGGVDQRGGAPGTRETDALQPVHLVQTVHAVVLAGGSAFGLEAAGGAVRYLEERGIGFDTRVVRVPIVPAAILYDLGVGRPDVRPDAVMGYQACLNASADSPQEGNVGAGIGATVGKILGMSQAMKGGIGTASVSIGGGVIIGAIAAVNVLGDIIDPAAGRIVAGARLPGQGAGFADTLVVMRSMAGKNPLTFGAGENTVIGAVATNARLDRQGAIKVAQMAHDGLARAVRPAHTMFDGDTIFALSLGRRQADVSAVGAFAAEVFAQAILRAVRAARSLAGLPAASEVEI